MKQLKEFKSLGSLTSLSWLQLLTANLLIFAPIGDFNSEYYVLLRYLVFISSILSIKKYLNDIQNSNFLFIIICLSIILILFNPIFPIYFWNKTEWILPDLLSGIFFIFIAVSDYKIIDKKTKNL